MEGYAMTSPKMSHKGNAQDRAQRRRVKLAAMLADPSITLQKAAQLLKVSRKTVQRDLAEMRPDIQEAQNLVAEYQASIRARLPIDERVDLYVENARQSTNPFARQKALERLDDLDGILTESERLRISRDREPKEPAPMFILPEGAHINVTWNQQNNTIQAPPEATEPECEPEPNEQG
jgi:transcriptional antiterminator